MKNVSETAVAIPSEAPSAVVVTSAQSSLLSVIEKAASDKSVDMEKMERLLNMHERICAKQAEQEFNDAMRAVQAETPRILRDATNPATKSKYTRLESLLKIVIPIYTKHGFSMSFGTDNSPLANHYRITAIVSHTGGHSRPAQCDIPIDNEGMQGNANKTKTHGFGSTMSYGRRYLTLLVFNVALVNEDDDKKGDGKVSTSGRVVTADTRVRFAEITKDIHQKILRFAIDKKYIEPNQTLDDLPDSVIPTTKGELERFRKEVEAHQ